MHCSSCLKSILREQGKKEVKTEFSSSEFTASDKNFSEKQCQLLVFSVTPFKIDPNKNQNRSTDEVQSFGKERR